MEQNKTTNKISLLKSYIPKNIQFPTAMPQIFSYKSILPFVFNLLTTKLLSYQNFIFLIMSRWRH